MSSISLILVATIVAFHPVLSLSSMNPYLKAEWKQLDLKAVITPRRSGHVAFQVDGKLFVFGGYAEEDAKDETTHRYVTNDLWEWKGEGWFKHSQLGEVPGPRLVSAAAVVNGSPYLLGGWDPQTEGTGGVILDTVHRLDVSSCTWSTIPATLPDGPASRHVALTLPDNTRALLHNHRCTDHVWILDGKSNTFLKQPTTGTAPSSRGLHAAVMAGTCAVIFGGAAQNGQMSNEAIVLDTDSWKWTTIKLQTPACPSPRAGASLCRFNDDCVILFGGAEATEAGLNPRGDVWVLKFDKVTGEGRWDRLLDDLGGQTSPPPRNAATLSPLDSSYDSADTCFLLSGGWAPFRRTWNDSFVLHVSSVESTEPADNKSS